MAPKKPTPASQSRGPRGAGSVFFNAARGYWQGKVITGRNPDTGKAVYTWVRGETQKAALKAKQELEATAAPATASMTVEQWCARWMESLSGKPQTKDDYEVVVRMRIVPALGSLKIAAVTTFDIEQAVKKWVKEAANTTVRKWVAVLSSCFQQAHRAELITRNPVRPAKKPKSDPQKFDLFTPSEMQLIVATGLTRPRWRPIAVCAATGCRIGEALAIQPDGYDASTGMLTISRTRTRMHGIGTPKSRHSTRTIRVPLAARPALEAGVPTAGYTVQRRAWCVLLELLGIRARGMHQLRHTIASHWIAAGVPIAEVAKYLGDTVLTVMRTYCHATGTVDPSIATDALLGDGKVTPPDKTA